MLFEVVVWFAVVRGGRKIVIWLMILRIVHLVNFEKFFERVPPTERATPTPFDKIPPTIDQVKHLLNIM